MQINRAHQVTYKSLMGRVTLFVNVTMYIHRFKTGTKKNSSNTMKQALHCMCYIISVVLQKDTEARDERIKHWEEFKVVTTRKAKPKVSIKNVVNKV